jgi:hypothetical protein
MKRNLQKFEESSAFSHKMQLDYFHLIRGKIIKKAKWYKDRFYDLEMWDRLMTEAESMKFQFNKKEATINFGYCEKQKKDGLFIPNTFQYHTQDCFLHRKEGNGNII